MFKVYLILGIAIGAGILHFQDGKVAVDTEKGVEAYQNTKQFQADATKSAISYVLGK